MEKKKKLSMKLLLAKVLLLLLLLLVSLASSQPTGLNSIVCKVKVSELAECLPAIAGNSPPKPTKECCDVLKKADLHCLCKHKSDLSKFGANPAKALELPKKCGLKAPQECQTKH